MKIFFVIPIALWLFAFCGFFRSIQNSMQNTEARKAGILCETWNPDNGFLATFTKLWVIERHKARHHEYPYGLPSVDVCDEEDFPTGGGTHGMITE